MSSENRAAAVVDWIARLAGRIAPMWSPLKERARKNPGFLAAAAAGTIGLALALGLLANAGLDWFSGSDRTADQELANDDLQFDLGNEDDLADTSPYADSFAQIRAESQRAKLISREEEETDPILGTRAAGPRQVNGRHVLDEDERSALEIDDEEFPSAEEHPLPARAVRQFSRNEKIDDADDDADLDEHPLAENAGNGRSRVRLPADLDDEQTIDQSETESDTELDDARDSLTRDPPGKLKKAKGTSVAANPLTEDDDSESDVSEETPPGGHPLSVDDSDTGDDTHDALDAADPAKSPKNKKRTAVVIDDLNEDQAQTVPAQAPGAGWKRQLTQEGDSAPTLSARQSRPVETVIYSVPEARSPAAKAASQPNESADSALRIEVLGPKSVGVGQTCSVEIRVTNRGLAPEQKLALEVELPAGLEHDVARNLSQTIGELGPGKMYRALLNLKAVSSGKALIRIDVERQGQIDATSSATIEVGGKPVVAERAILLDCCCPLLPCCAF